MAASDNSLNKLNKSQLIEVVHSLQQRERNVAAQRDDFAHQLNARQIRIANAGSIAEASLALSGIFESAQYAADEYVASVRTMMDEVYQASAQSAEAANARAAQAVQQSQIDANNILTEANSEAERIVGEATSEAERVTEEAKREAIALIGEAEAEANRIITEANATASKIVAEAQASAKVTFDHAESILVQAKSLAAEQARASIPHVQPYAAPAPADTYESQDVSSASITAEIPLISVDGASRVTPVEFEPRETLLQKVTRAAAASKPKRSGAHAQQSVVSRALGTLDLLRSRAEGRKEQTDEVEDTAGVFREVAPREDVLQEDAFAEEASVRLVPQGVDARPASANPRVAAAAASAADEDELELDGAFAGSRWFVDDDLDDGLLEEGSLEARKPSGQPAAAVADEGVARTATVSQASEPAEASEPAPQAERPASETMESTGAAATEEPQAGAADDAGRDNAAPADSASADASADESAVKTEAESAADAAPAATDAADEAPASAPEAETEDVSDASEPSGDADEPDDQVEPDDSDDQEAADTHDSADAEEADTAEAAAAGAPDTADNATDAAGTDTDDEPPADKPSENKIDSSSWIFIDSGISVD